MSIMSGYLFREAINDKLAAAAPANLRNAVKAFSGGVQKYTQPQTIKDIANVRQLGNILGNRPAGTSADTLATQLINVSPNLKGSLDRMRHYFGPFDTDYSNSVIFREMIPKRALKDLMANTRRTAAAQQRAIQLAEYAKMFS